MNRRGFLSTLLGAGMLAAASVYKLVPAGKPKVETLGGPWEYVSKLDMSDCGAVICFSTPRMERNKFYEEWWVKANADQGRRAGRVPSAYVWAEPCKWKFGGGSK